MDQIAIDTWESIKTEGWCAILLGNSASIAIHKEFAYSPSSLIGFKPGEVFLRFD